MTQETFWLVVASAAVVVAVAMVLLALVAGSVARDARRLLRSIDSELEPTLRQARQTAAVVEGLVTAVQPRLERLDRLADETEETLVAVREAAAAASSIVRGPADVVEGARRTAESVGRGILNKADQIRRQMSGDEAVDPDREAMRE